MTELKTSTSLKSQSNNVIKQKEPWFYILITVIAIVVVVGIIQIYGGVSRKNWAANFDPNMLKGLSEQVVYGNVTALPEDYKKLSSHGNLVLTQLEEEIERLYGLYLKEEMDTNSFNNGMEGYSLIPAVKDYALNKMQVVTVVEEGRKHYKEASRLAEEGNMSGAAPLFALVPVEDSVYYPISQQSLLDLKESINLQIARKVGLYLSRFKPEEATSYLESLKNMPENETFIEEQQIRITEYMDFQTNLVPYEGPVEHMFTHCLIAFPEICYSSPSMMKSLDTDCVTPYEFNIMITNLYEKGYMLIDINTLIEDVDEEGNIVKIKQLMLPEGKKPLVLSVDDVVYDARKMSTGMVDKLMIDDEGLVYTYTKHLTGEEVISYENEVFPFIDQFLMDHPEFSFQGARGTLALTGFQGILGYRTQAETPEGVNRDEEIAKASLVVEGLKNNGWTFGSHSYGHAHMRERMNYEQFATDTKQWQDEVASIVGNSKIFFYPYGESVKQTDPKFDALYNTGFRLICGVGSRTAYLIAYKDGRSLFQDRRSLDGYSLRNFKEHLSPFFNTDEVIDPIRP